MCKSRAEWGRGGRDSGGECGMDGVVVWVYDVRGDDDEGERERGDSG